MIYRHGDLCIKSIEKLPEGLKKLNTNIVAEGGATGHSHTLLGQDFEIYEDAKGVMYLSIASPTEITHQEHETKEIGKGYYIIEREQEFDPFSEEINKVRD
jgi:hypothetical protein